MASQATESSSGDDWRLEAELDVEQPSGPLHSLVGRFGGADVIKDVESGVPQDVVVTHDGKLLFAYAPSEDAIAAARRGIEETLRRDGVGASIRVSHWQDGDDRWVQVDPPPSAAEERAQEARERDDETVETRTMVASSGRWVRREFEETMAGAAARLGLQCSIAEHPHLLTTQVAFTVTGPKRRIDEFAGDLRAEGWTTVRGDAWLVGDAL